MEAVGSSETLVDISNIVWHINPEDQHQILHDKLTVIQPAKKFPTLYGTHNVEDGGSGFL
jgi:hypothetical protein